jgi:hypothetical protein
MFAIFDAPAAALRTAIEATAAVRDTGLEIRSGVHLGEVEQDREGRVSGIAVHVGAPPRSPKRVRSLRLLPRASSPAARGSASRIGANGLPPRRSAGCFEVLGEEA